MHISMTTAQILQTAVARVLSVAQPLRIILFGSYARGDADAQSDIDLLVVEQDVADRGQEMLRLTRSIGYLGLGVDVLVYSEQEVARRGQVPGTLLYHALNEGKVLYDART
ncbi:MAG: nucleotidyltransferase domain-containing protein [Pseudomonadota bacterium]|nr:nucleotidyltransferase domain-containing protein [Pseudomonadota bacterium]